MFSRHVIRDLSAYYDGELDWKAAARVDAHLRTCARCAAAYDRISHGARLAAALRRVAPPPAVGDAVAAGVRARAGAPAVWRRARPLLSGRGVGAALVTTALALFVVVVFHSNRAAPISADELLKQAEAVVGTTVQPGQVLYRRWSIQRTTTGADGHSQDVRWTMDIWHTGPHLNRTVARIHDGNGELIAADARLDTPDGPRSVAYYSPAYPRGPRGVMIEWYSDAERRAAIARLPDPERRLLEPAVLARDEPLVLTESRMNRALIQNPQHSPRPIVRRVVSLEPVVAGEKVFRVRVVQPKSPWLDWADDAAARWSTARVESVCSIDARSKLAWKYESTVALPDGSRYSSVQTLELLRAEWPTTDPERLFRRGVPYGTPTRRIDAYDYLSGFAKAALASWDR